MLPWLSVAQAQPVIGARARHRLGGGALVAAHLTQPYVGSLGPRTLRLFIFRPLFLFSGSVHGPYGSYTVAYRRASCLEWTARIERMFRSQWLLIRVWVTA
jgi:hypothetical protein